MSENVEAPASSSVVTDSAPTPTSEVAARVYESFETSGGETPDTPDSESAEPATPVEPAAPVELSPAAKFLLEQGHKSENGRGGKTYLPYATVEKMLERFASTHEKTWTSERETLSKEAQAAKAHLDALRASVQGEDTDAFLKEIAGINPRFARYLQQQAAPPQAPVDFPQPDLPLPDGSATYSIKGLREQVFPWMLQQAEERAKATAAEALKPLAEREKQAQAKADEDAKRQSIREEMRAAESWPMFGKLGDTTTEFQAEVLAELRKDSEQAERLSALSGKRVIPKMTFRQAYLEVYARHQEPDKVRARMAQELNAAPKGTSVARTAGEVPAKVGKVRSTAEVAAATMARLERQGA